ncbi:hypothetical protein LTR50_002473 [Elasticomyces elasticus]|nr:hypothetical protein LTR50_002473 [Elasticomyces elasticus]
MAAPDSVTLKDLSGTWVLQGISWLVRRAIAYSTITLYAKEYVDDAKVYHIDIDQVSSPGSIKNREERALDWVFREKDDSFFGKVKGRTRWIKLEDVSDEYMNQGWAKECVEGEVIDAYVESVGGGWVAEQIWGFAEVDGGRRHVRRSVVKKGKQVERVSLDDETYARIIGTRST